MAVILSETAAQEIARVKDEQDFPEGMFLRIGVAGGGCSGFSYSLGFDDKFDDTADSKLVHYPEATAPGTPLGPARSIPLNATLPLTCAVTEFAAAIRAGSRDLTSLRLGADVVAILDQCQKLLTPS